MDSRTNDEDFVSAINELFNERIPFNKVLGLKVESISYERVKVSFQMRDELMGHYKRRMLHGGLYRLLLMSRVACPRLWAFNKKCRARH
jgi:acyl-coenzyme A thioesterase PaaI-like protein